MIQFGPSDIVYSVYIQTNLNRETILFYRSSTRWCSRIILQNTALFTLCHYTYCNRRTHWSYTLSTGLHPDSPVNPIF